MSDDIKETLIEDQPIPVDIEGTKIILSQLENCICKIIKDDGKKGTGFFSKIPFPNKNNLLYVLITNNHILNENDIENDKIIKLIIYNKEQSIEKEIRIDDSRKKMTIINEEEGIDITIIEIKPNKDKINNFLEIDDKILELECKRKSIYILHYPKDKQLVSYGLINDILERKKINHYCNTEDGSSGSPILSLNNFKVIGVHYGGSKNKIFKLNYGTFIKYAINEFNNKFKNEIKNEKIIKSENIKIEFNNINKNEIKIGKNNKSKKSKVEFNKNNKNEIKLMYYTEKEGIFNIFGEKFVENNKDNIDLIINGVKQKLIIAYKLKKGENNIKLIIKNKIINLEFMFYKCKSLKNIDELKYLDTKHINNFSYIFSYCSSLTDLNGLEIWDVSNSNNFEYMFGGCELLSNINALKNWNVLNANNFEYMFYECKSLKDLNGLQNWDVSNAINFQRMFCGCSSLKDLNGLKNWNISNVNNFNNMFNDCKSLIDISGIQNWKVLSGNNFQKMFFGCSSSLDLYSLQQNWNLPKTYYEQMK